MDRSGGAPELCGPGALARASHGLSAETLRSTVCKSLWCCHHLQFLKRPPRYSSSSFLGSRMWWTSLWFLFEAGGKKLFFRKFKVLKRSRLTITLSLLKSSMPRPNADFWLNFAGRWTSAFYVFIFRQTLTAQFTQHSIADVFTVKYWRQVVGCLVCLFVCFSQVSAFKIMENSTWY